MPFVGHRLVTRDVDRVRGRFTKQASTRNLECFNSLWSDKLAKPNYAFAKRQRDLAKKQKKEAKRQKKAESGATSPVATDEQSPPPEKIVPQ